MKAVVDAIATGYYEDDAGFSSLVNGLCDPSGELQFHSSFDFSRFQGTKVLLSKTHERMVKSSRTFVACFV